MNQEMYIVIKNNYTELFKTYCQYQDKYRIIVNAQTCEDLFNDKILFLIQQDIALTIDMIRLFIKTKRPYRKGHLEFRDEIFIHIPDEPIDEDKQNKEKLRYLFIDYRPEKKSKK